MYLGTIIQRFSKILVLDFLSSVLLIFLQTVHRLYTNSWCTIYCLKKKKRVGQVGRLPQTLKLSAAIATSLLCFQHKGGARGTQLWVH